ncbi:MAG: hypothetical protein GEV07_20135 [Streptosporangiales bacterium]|nr:hypothetical protein [Streptosporangiales bacterium]
MRGDHMRVVSITGAFADLVAADWYPPDELADTTRAAAAVVLYNAMVLTEERSRPIRDLLARLGTSEDGDRRVNALVRAVLVYDPADEAGMARRLDELVADPDPYVQAAGLQRRSHLLENSGDPAGAVAAAERALALPGEVDGPWSAAIVRAQLAGLHMQLGNRTEAVAHARTALPVLDRLGATDDVIQLRSTLVLAAVACGRLDEAAAELVELERLVVHGRQVLGGMASVRLTAAELTLARGEVAAGLAAYQDAVAEMRVATALGIPTTGLEPWVLFGESATLTAFALYGGDEQLAAGDELFLACLRRGLRALDADRPHLDYPVCGTVLFGLAAWGLVRSALPAAEAVRLLVLAERFAYNRTLPTMAWENLEPYAERSAPGRISALRAEYGNRGGPDLLGEARQTLDRHRCRL